MRFMIQLWSDERAHPDALLVAAMARYNDKLSRANVLLVAEGLLSSARGSRISMAGGQREISQGPFEPRAACVGFWIVRVTSKLEALEWAKQCPLSDGDVLELRELYGLPDELLPSDLSWPEPMPCELSS